MQLEQKPEEDKKLLRTNVPSIPEKKVYPPEWEKLYDSIFTRQYIWLSNMLGGRYNKQKDKDLTRLAGRIGNRAERSKLIGLVQ